MPLRIQSHVRKWLTLGILTQCAVPPNMHTYHFTLLLKTKSKTTFNISRSSKEAKVWTVKNVTQGTSQCGPKLPLSFIFMTSPYDPATVNDSPVPGARIWLSGLPRLSYLALPGQCSPLSVFILRCTHAHFSSSSSILSFSEKSFPMSVSKARYPFPQEFVMLLFNFVTHSLIS